MNVLRKVKRRRRRRCWTRCRRRGLTLLETMLAAMLLSLVAVMLVNAFRASPSRHAGSFSERVEVLAEDAAGALAAGREIELPVDTTATIDLIRPETAWPSRGALVVVQDGRALAVRYVVIRSN